MPLSAPVESDFDLTEFWPWGNSTHKHNPLCMAVSTGLRACTEEEGRVNVYVCLADGLIPAQGL